MPRPSKRKADEIDFEDPMTFVLDYCNRHGISQEPGNSDIEKECSNRAMEAREDYKEKRDKIIANNADNNSATGNVANDRKGLSPAQKYTIRLENNRKSANASKVYNEVFKRELSHRLQRLSTSLITNSCSKCCELQDRHMIESNEYVHQIRSLQEYIEQLEDRVQEQEHKLAEQKVSNRSLNDVMASAKNHVQLVKKDEQAVTVEEGDRDLRSSPDGVPEASVHPSVVQDRGYNDEKETGESTNPKTKPPPLLHIGCTPESPEEREVDVPSKTEIHEHSGSMKQVGNAYDCTTDPEPLRAERASTEVQVKVMETPSSFTSQSQDVTFKQRMATAGLLSFLCNEGDSQDKLFRSGLTQTQSQNEDTDDKAQLLRNLPSSGGIPTGILGSGSIPLVLPSTISSLGSDSSPARGESNESPTL